MTGRIIIAGIYYTIIGLWLHTAGAQVRENSDSRKAVREIVELTLRKNPTIQSVFQSINARKGVEQSARGEFNLFYIGALDIARTLQTNDIISRPGPVADELGLEVSRKYQRRSVVAYSLGISKKFQSGLIINPSIGVTSGHDFVYDYLEDADLDPVFTNRGSVFFNFTQPLLFGRGKAFNTGAIRRAKAQISQQEKQYIFTASEQVYNSLSAYLFYLNALNNLRIQTASQDSFEKLLSRLGRLVEADVIPAGDLLYLQGILTNQRNSRLTAENAVQLARAQLGAFIGLDNKNIDDRFGLRFPEDFNYPVDSIDYSPGLQSLDSLLDIGFQRRMDLEALDKSIQVEQINAEIARLSLKPQLDLRGGIGYNGLYEATALGNPIGYIRPYFNNVPGLSYSLGLQLSVAPKFDTQRGQLLTAKSNIKELENFKQAIKNNILYNIRRSFNDLVYYKDIVRQSYAAVRVAKRAVQNEVKKLNLGSSTIINVMQTQTNLIFSETALNQALYNLNLAILSLKFFTGTLITEDDVERGNVGSEIFMMPN